MRASVFVPIEFLEKLASNHPEMSPVERMALAAGMINGLLQHAVTNLEIRSWQLKVVPTLSRELEMFFIFDEKHPEANLQRLREVIEALFFGDFEKIEITFAVNEE